MDKTRYHYGTGRRKSAVARVRGLPFVVSIHGGLLDVSPALRTTFNESSHRGFEWGKIFGLLLQSRRRPVVTGQEALLGAKGECIIWRGNEGRVQVQGEVWRARADEALLPGTRIRVVGREGLVLVVEPI